MIQTLNIILKLEGIHSIKWPWEYFFISFIIYNSKVIYKNSVVYKDQAVYC